VSFVSAAHFNDDLAASFLLDHPSESLCDFLQGISVAYERQHLFFKRSIALWNVKGLQKENTMAATL
jgi:hypothetical protein